MGRLAATLCQFANLIMLGYRFYVYVLSLLFLVVLLNQYMLLDRSLRLSGEQWSVRDRMAMFSNGDDTKQLLKIVPHETISTHDLFWPTTSEMLSHLKGEIKVGAIYVLYVDNDSPALSSSSQATRDNTDDDDAGDDESGRIQLNVKLGENFRVDAVGLTDLDHYVYVDRRSGEIDHYQIGRFGK